MVTATGSYSATAPLSSGQWIMQMVAFRTPAGGTTVPTVSSVSPNGGPTAGGTAVTITGTNFATGATVTFGSAAATNVVVVSGTQITATTPAGAAGAVTVTVTVSGQSGSLNNGFTYSVPPTVSSVSPNSGSTGGGIAVTITGTNFATGATVTFGSTAATNVVVVSGTQITATTPTGTAGAVTVTVTNPGALSGSLTNGFTYVVTTPTAPTGLTVTDGGPVPTFVNGQGYYNSTSLATHTTASFNSTGGDGILLFASSHQGVTFTPSDSFGNTWISIAGPTSTTAGFDLRSEVWYAPNPVVGPGHTITMNLSIAQPLVMSIVVVKGSNTSSPIDAISLIGSDNGTSTVNVISPSLTTLKPNDLLVGFVKTNSNETFTAGSGFSLQSAATVANLTAETGPASTPNNYDATFTLSAGVTWQSVIGAVAENPNQTTLSWTASTETGGVISNYLVERCQTAGCANFAQIGTTTTTSLNDTGLTASATYSYRVRAQDTANTLGPYSSVVTITIPAPIPSLPGNLTATPASSTQTNLAWQASTETGGTVSTYLIQRCQGVGCTNFTQIATSTTATYSDTGLTAGGSYSYRLQASDSAGSVSPFSNVASVTLQGPPVVSSVSPNNGTTAGGTAVTITGTNFVTGATVTFGSAAATNVVVVSGTQITATTPAGTAGPVTVTVTNPGAQSGSLASGFTYLLVTNTTINYVQGNFLSPQTPQTTVSVTYTSAQAAGDLNVVVVGWSDSTATVSTVTDKSGNAYALAVGPTVQTGVATQSIYYAKNIASSAAGANTVTVTFSTAAAYPDIRILEYSGADPNNPVDVTAANAGNSTSSSASATTTNATDLIFGANLVQSATSGPGSGFTTRLLTSPDGDIAEDEMVSGTGSYTATAALISGDWIMQMVAFRTPAAASGPISVSLSPVTANVPTGYGTQIFSATLQNDPYNQGVTWSLSGSGCSGSTCGTLTNLATMSVTYNAPASVPNPAAVTLTATSITDNTKSATATITVTQGSINVSVSPKRAAVTASQTEQFTATVVNDPANGGVSWSVDAISGGTSTSGTITAAGLYTPGTQAGQHTVTATSNSNTSVSASVSIAVTDLAGVYTYHNDTSRTGQNLKEYALTTSNVNSSTFGELFSCPIDGYAYAQPLYVANLLVGSTTRNVVFIATEHDSVYAFDADSPSCIQLWHTSFLGTGVTTMSWQDTGSNPTNDVYPEIGITSTPVIDPTTNTIYVEAKTKESVGTGCSSSSPCYVHRLHALDITTGLEKFGGPIVISAPNFSSLHHFNRPALLLNNGTVYVAFGSHGDLCPWQGWLFAYNSATLVQKFAWSTTDPKSGCNGGAVWQGGSGPALDASGNIYFSTGNGTFNANTGGINYGDSAIKLSPTGGVLDYFTPYNQSTFDTNDIDLASAGVVILPDSVGSTSHPHLALATGKVGILYLLDQTSMGKFHSGSNSDVQEVTPVPPPNTTNFDGGIFGSPAYWNGNIYVTGVNYPLEQFLISNGLISSVSLSNSANTFPLRGASPAISANGTTNGIVWILDLSGWQSNQPGILDAYDATNLATLLYSSPSSGSAASGAAVKFTVPTVANGKVYIGCESSFSVFGLLPN